MSENLFTGNISGKRHKLSEVVPLRVPYSIGIWPIYACNFRCTYCMMSIPENKRGRYYQNLGKRKMELTLFKKIIDDIKLHQNAHLKTLDFAGMGEPLLHPELPSMIAYAKNAGIADCISVYTNASLLRPKLSERITNAGLDRIRISLQGLDASAYASTSSAKIDFLELKKNIKYLFNHKKHTKVYIKIIDISCNGREDEFVRHFSDMADDLAIEHLEPLFEGVDYEKFNHLPSTTLHGYPIKKVAVCPQPFYKLVIAPNGDCFCCCVIHEDTFIGNCNELILKDIWNGKLLHEIRTKQLSKRKNMINACKKCGLYYSLMSPEDNLDDKCDDIMKRLIDTYNTII